MRASILSFVFGVTLVFGVWNDGEAADLTGVWTGTQSCKRVDSLRGASRTRVQKTFFVSGDYLSFEGEESSYRIHVVGETGSRKVELGLASCGGEPWSAFAGRFKVSTDPRSGKGVMRGTTTSSRAGLVESDVTICRWSFKRTSTVGPKVMGCEKQVKVHVVTDAAVDRLSVVVAYPPSADLRGPYACGADRLVRLEETDSGEGHLLLELSPGSNADSLKFPLELRCPFSPVAGSYFNDDSFEAIVLSAEANGLRLSKGIDLVVDVVP